MEMGLNGGLVPPVTACEGNGQGLDMDARGKRSIRGERRIVGAIRRGVKGDTRG
jgi:hypothetical protein